jgi:hypothetical protein
MTRMLDLPNICTRWSLWPGWDLFKELGSSPLVPERLPYG